MKKKDVSHNFKSKFIYVLVGSIAFTQGIMGLSDLSINYLLKDDYKLDPAETQFFQTIITLPWIFKPFWGILTDTVPLLGFRRKSYLILFGIIGFVLWNILADYGTQSKLFGIGLLVGINIAISFCSVIGEALLVELSSNQLGNDESSASSNVTFFFGMVSVGTLFTAYFSGELLDFLDKKQIFRITSTFPLFLSLIAVFVNEKKYSPQTDKIETWESLKQIWEFIKQPIIYRPIMLILVFASGPTASSAMFYFYSDVLHFGPEFLGELNFGYSIGSIISAYLFNKFLKNCQFKKVFGISTIFYFLVSSSTIILVSRKNVQYGIPDKVFCFGDGVLNYIISELNSMPVLVLACKMCPKNIEGTMYAILMSALNLGSAISEQIGALLILQFGVTDTDFHNLSNLILLTSICSLIPLPLTNIIDEEEMEKILHQYKLLEDGDYEPNLQEIKESQL